MAETCGYYYGTLDVSDEDHLITIECDRRPDHIGEHTMTLRWATRPEDICAKLGHDWGRWRKLEEPKPLPAMVGTASALLAQASAAGGELSDALLAGLLFPNPPGEWEVEPTKERRCKRCKRHETDGVWQSRISDTYFVYNRDQFQAADAEQRRT